MVWDVRTTITGHTEWPPSVNPQYSRQEEEENFQKINIMCFLTEGVNYKTLYGDMYQWWPAMMIRIKSEWPRHSDFAVEIQDQLKVYFGNIEARVKSERDAGRVILFRKLWTEPNLTGAYLYVYQQFEQLLAASSWDKMFCFPFWDLRQIGNLVTDAEMDEHIRNVGDITLRHLYTLPYDFVLVPAAGGNPAVTVHMAVDYGKRTGILTGEPQALYIMSVTKPQGGGGANYRTCATAPATGCKTAPSGWCSVSSTGACTSG